MRISVRVLLALALLSVTRAAVAAPDASDASTERDWCEDGDVNADGGRCPDDLSARARLDKARRRAAKDRLIDALRDAHKALEAAATERDVEATRDARALIEKLVSQIPHVTFVPPSPPPGDLTVRFDERSVPIDSLGKRFAIDPGKHIVVAEAHRDGTAVGFKEYIEVTPGQLVTVRIVLAADTCSCMSALMTRCLQAAKSAAEAERCSIANIPSQGCRACLVAPARETPAPVHLVAALPVLALAVRRLRRRAPCRARPPR